MKFRKILLVAAAALTAFGVSSCYLEESTLLQQQPPSKTAKSINFSGAEIILGTRHSLPEYTAAQELSKVLKYQAYDWERYRRGVVVPMDKRPQGGAIVIGDLDSPLIQPIADKLDLKKSADDVCVQTVIDGNLILAGNSPRAAMYSVFDFMQRQMGVRWLFEGEQGTFYTKRGCSVPENFYRKIQGGFRFRQMGVDTKHFGDDSPRFNARNFAQQGEFEFGGERYFGGETIQPYRSDYKDHPEHFALLNGVRYLPPGDSGWCWVINGCWSNKGFTDLCIKRIKEGIVRNHANHISIHPADTDRRCECENCKKMIDPDLSSRYFKYHANIVREIKKEFPNLRYSVLAYQEYREVPAADVEEVEFVEYCQYSRCFIHKIGDPNCGTNKVDFDRLARWEKEKNVPMGVWDYTFDVFTPGYALPTYQYFADEIMNFYGRKFVKLFIEGSDCMRFSRPARWVALQMMWEPEAKTCEEWLKDYCRAAYGPAAAEMENYHRKCAEAWDGMKAHLTACFNNAGGTAKAYLTPELIALSEKTFATAEAKINAIKLPNTKNKEELARATNLKAQYAAAVKYEKDAYLKWKELHDKMMSNSVQMTAYVGDFNDLAKEPGTPMNTRDKWNKDKAPKGTASVSWQGDKMFVRIVCNTPAGKTSKPQPFKLRKDGDMAYGAESVELFIQAPGSPTYYQFAAGRNGDFYDGEALNGKWDGKWSHTVKDTPEGWVYEIVIPFSNFGVKGPGSEPWKMMIIRNGSGDCPYATGVPYAGHHDIAAGADVTFATGKRP